MNLSLNAYLEFARFTVQSPRQAARQVLDANIPVAARWQALILTAVVSAITVHFYMALYPVAPDAEAGPVMISPFATMLLDLGFNLGAVFLVHAVGRWRGGNGRWEDALILIAWLQSILIILQLIQLVAVVLIPPLGSIIGIISVALYFWLISNFIAELHGFPSVGRVFLGVLLTMVVMVFALAFLMLPLIGQGV